MSRGSTRDGPPKTNAPASDDVSINWHRDESDGQVILGAESDRVRIAVAFPVDVVQSELRTVLDERDRELVHYFDRLGHGPE